MKSFVALCRIEFLYTVRQWGFWLSYLLFAAIGFTFVNTIGSPQFPLLAAAGIYKINAPVLVHTAMATVCLMMTFVISSYTGKAAIRDFRYITFPVIFSFPVGRSSYIAGKFMSICLSNLLLFTAPVWGYALACQMPWLDRSSFLPFSFATYGYAYMQVVVVNVFFLTALFFMLGLLARNIMINWVAIIVLYAVYYLGITYGGDPGMYTLRVLLDPYGFTGITTVGGGAVTMHGLYAWNRLLWVGMGVIVLLYVFLRFRFQHFQSVVRPGRSRPVSSHAQAAEKIAAAPPMPHQDFGRRFMRKAFIHQLYMECRQIFRSRYFYVIFSIALIFLYLTGKAVDKLGGSVTAYQIVELFSASMHIFIILLIAVLGGEAVWRDIERRIGSITGCLPIPRHLLFAARTAAVFVLVLCMATIVFIASALYLLRSNEAISGQLLFSLIYLYGYVAVGYLYYCVLSVGVQALADNKYRGYVLFAFVNFLPFQFSSSVISRNIWVPG